MASESSSGDGSKDKVKLRRRTSQPENNAGFRCYTFDKTPATREFFFGLSNEETYRLTDSLVFITINDNSLTKPDLQSATNPRKTIPGASKSIRQNIIRMIFSAPNPKAFVPSFGLASPDEGARGAVGNIPIQCRLKQTERMTSNKFKLKQNQLIFCSNFDQLANHVQKSLEKCILQRVCYSSPTRSGPFLLGLWPNVVMLLQSPQPFPWVSPSFHLGSVLLCPSTGALQSALVPVATSQKVEEESDQCCADKHASSRSMSFFLFHHNLSCQKPPLPSSCPCETWLQNSRLQISASFGCLFPQDISSPRPHTPEVSH